MPRQGLRGLVVIGTLVALSGCEALGTAAQSKTNQGALLGGLLGAGTGAIIGNQAGHHAGAGTAIGGALGALGGGLLGHALEEQGQATQSRQVPPATTTSITPGQVKFCPAGGETYPASMKYCPIHGVELRVKEDAASGTATPMSPASTNLLP